MFWSISIVCILVVGALTAQVPSASKHHRTPKHCGFEFDYPSDWVITSSDDKTCRVQLRPGDLSSRMKARDVDLYTLEVALEGRDFLYSAATYFDFIRGKWLVRGRQGATTDAEVVVTERWHGLRGTVAAGCHHESGGYAGLCESPVVVLRDDDDHMWSMIGGPQSEGAFEAILATLRFVEQ